MDYLELIFKKLDTMEDRLDSMDVKQAEHNKDLKEHMRRSENNEEAIGVLRLHVDESQAELKKHLHGLKYIFWGITALGAIASAIFGIIKLIGAI